MSYTFSTVSTSYSNPRISRFRSFPQHFEYCPCDTLPLYNRRAPFRCPRNQCDMPPTQPADLMKTIDLRYEEEEPQGRSSFALSDIFEEEEHEIEISTILPSSPQTTTPSSSLKRRKFRLQVPTLFIDLALFVRDKFHRSGDRTPTPTSSNSKLDLFT